MPKKNIFLTFCLFSSLTLPTLTRSHEISPVIHSSKQDIEKSELTSAVSVISSEEMESIGGERLGDKLQNTAGVEVAKTGVSGGQAAIFLRGLDARHTAFAIDGVRVYDAASIQRLLNPSIISSYDIERIEVLRGAQSVLYGSDAIGGVINIITKKDNVKNRITVDLGQQSRYATDNSFLLNKIIVNLKTFYQEDLYNNDLVVGSEKDKKFNKGASLNFSYIGDKIESYTRLKLIHDFSEIDGQDFISDLPIDTDGAIARVEQLSIQQSFKWSFSPSQKLHLDLSKQKSKRLNSSGNFESLFEGDLTQSELRYVNKNSLLGINATNEIYKDQSIDKLELDMLDVYANHLINFTHFDLEGGGRITSNEFYGNHFVYNLGISKKISKIHRFHFSQKTGFKAPTPYQLFGVTPFGPVGNKDLIPEKSIGAEIGYQLALTQLQYEINLFQNSLENAIGFNQRYLNVSSLFNQGLEMILKFQKKRYELSANLTLLDFGKTDEAFTERKPKESFNLVQFYKLDDENKLGVNYRYRGTRVENINNTRFEILSAYSIVDLTYKKEKGPYSFQLTILNIFDQKYEEAHLFRAQRFGGQARFTYSY